MANIPRLIAHRGYAQRYPENTLPAITEALRAGACGIEFDVQVTDDRIPVLSHDDDLQRTAGLDGRITMARWSELKSVQVNEASRFGNKFTDIKIPTLAETVMLLQEWPHIPAFVEIKEESLERHGTDRAVKAVMNVIKPALEQCVVISYDVLALHCARAMGAPRVGWVLHEWNEETKLTATKLTPDFLFCNYKKIPTPPARLWAGPWQWALYEITDPELALKFAERGVQYIETMAVGEMLEHPALHEGACFAR